MKYILLGLILLSFWSCQPNTKKTPKKELEQPKVEKNSDLSPTPTAQNLSNEEVALQFLNAYISFARQGRSPAEIKTWLIQQENVSNELAEQYIHFIEHKEFLDFDPILNSQDFPDSFILSRTSGNHIFLTGKDWDGYEWVVKVKDAKVIGSGVINIKSTSSAPSFEEKMKKIKALYKKTNDNLSSYQLTKRNLHESTQGGTEKVYTYNNQIIKIEKKYLGEIGKQMIEYYFDKKGYLSFVFEQNTHYNAPIYTSQAEEGIEAFDPNKSTIEENRYYFYEETMIEWLDKNKQSVDSNHLIFKEKEEELLLIQQENQ